MKEFYHITIGELMEIKKISKMTMRDALPKIREVRNKHGFTDKEAQNLVCLARNFKTTMVLK